MPDQGQPAISDGIMTAEERLVTVRKVVESLRMLIETTEYKTLETILFIPHRELVARKLIDEALKEPLDTAELYRLQGDKRTIKKYDLRRILEQYHAELKGITLSANE